MSLRTLLITIGFWLMVVVALGYWRMYYAWHLGNAVIFFLHSLPLLVLGLALILILETLFSRSKS